MFYFMLFGITISLFWLAVSYFFEINKIEIEMDKKAKEIFEIKTEGYLKPFIKNIDNTINSLSNNKVILEYINSLNPYIEKDIEQMFLAIVGSQSQIMQLRLISKHGKEIVRIDRDKMDSTPFIVSKEKLQDKSDRDYFKIVSNMNKSIIWHSKFDLNIENGKIEIPYRPTFRASIPLFVKNDFIGMIIINVYIDELLKYLGKSTVFEHYIIDKDSNFILHQDNELSFNKYKNIPTNLDKIFPNSLNSKDIYTYSLDNILNNDDKAILIFKTRDAYKVDLINSKLNTALLIFVLTIILSFILSLYVSKNPSKLQVALLKANEKFKEFTSIIDKYVIISKTKTDSTIIEVSSAFIESSKYEKEELIGKKMNIIKNSQEDENKYKDLWETIKNGETWHGEIKNKNKIGEIYWLEQYIIPTIDKDNEEEIFVSVGTDVTAKKLLEEMATIDKLTGLYNRQMLDEFLRKEVEANKRHLNDLSIILIDIDHFKNVNDTFGHQMGDFVLATIAKLIMNNSRKSDIQGRYGGEEFVVICPKTEKKSALVLAEKIRLVVENFKFEMIGVKTISLGISSLDQNDTVEILIKKADIALYKAKNTGRNKVVIFENNEYLI